MRRKRVQQGYITLIAKEGLWALVLVSGNK